MPYRLLKSLPQPSRP
jgi:hypothetical protein